MQIIKGIPAAPGIAIGPGFHHQQAKFLAERSLVLDTEGEIDRLEVAINQAESDLGKVYEAARKKVGDEAAEIFSAHLMMLKDPDLLEAIRNKIQVERINAEAAVYEAAESYAEALQQLADEYLQARAADVRDVSTRVIKILRNDTEQAAIVSEPSIVIAEDLTPSDTIQYEREKLLGFFTEMGGATSHTAILSRALGIPAVVGAGAMPDTSGEHIFILDGNKGELIIDPDEATLASYTEKQKADQAKFADQLATASSPAITLDGKRIEVVANIGNLEDAKSAILNGAEGTGLFRTEFSYLEEKATPDEETLVTVYRHIFEAFGDWPIVVRTLDIGGDKEIPHLNLPSEANPFLGHRGIRLCLSRLDLFKPQLRAILRAGVNSNLFIMFPMIASVQEVRNARNVLDVCKSELESESVQFNKNSKVGVMIEVPSAALCADQLAKEVDFFSIGTNDLTQYTMAVDRTNAKVARLASGLQPAVLKLIKQVIDEGHKAGIWVGMCGEMAGDPTAVPILLGLGLDEFSMNSPAIPQAKALIRKWNTGDAVLLAQQALECETAEEIQNVVANWPL